jgi:hypothetical protein
MGSMNRTITPGTEGLLGLMKDTTDYISDVAQSSYTALQELPPARRYSGEIITRRRSARVPNRLFERLIALPDGPLAVGDDVTLTALGTETVTRVLPFGSRALSLPWQDTFVTAAFTHPGIAKNTIGTPRLALSERGFASYNNREYATPSGSSNWERYSSIEDLRLDAAKAHLNALAIVSVVSAGVARVSDLRPKSSWHDELVGQWLGVMPADHTYTSTMAKVVY